MTYNIIIKNGRIFDGTGNTWYEADIYVSKGKIKKIGKFPAVYESFVINAAGQVVSPGFIDMHTHSDWPLLVNPRAESKVRQGVTTEVIGNCGSSAAPLKGEAMEKAKKTAEDYEIELQWASMLDYMTTLERQGVALNVAALIGHGNLRASVLGYENREPTRNELDEMKELVKQSMEDGAFGMSTGLVYPPSSYASTNELIELCKVVSKQAGFYATHVRNYPSIGGVSEAIEIGQKSGIPVHISHFNNPAEARILGEKARNIGIDVTYDVVVYRRGETYLNALMPDWANEGGDERLVERLKDPVIREKIKNETLEKGNTVGGSLCRNLMRDSEWDKIWLSDCFVNREYCGKSFIEIANIRNVDDPFEAVFDLLIEEGGKGMMMGGLLSEEDIDAALNHNLSMVGSDGSALAPYGVLGRGKGNPRSYGTFSKIFSRYVRERKAIPLRRVIKKMTTFPALRLKLTDRGLLRPGMWADIVVFDKERIRNLDTYEDPYRYPIGINWVIVNGEIVIENGEHTGRLPGMVLKH